MAWSGVLGGKENAFFPNVREWVGQNGTRTDLFLQSGDASGTSVGFKMWTLAARASIHTPPRLYPHRELS